MRKRYNFSAAKKNPYAKGQKRPVTIYLDAKLHRALRVKAAETEKSVSELVNAAVQRSLSEDAADLAVFAVRAREPVIAFKALAD